MKKKKIMALLLMSSVMVTSPTLFTNPMVVFAEENTETPPEVESQIIEKNESTIAENTDVIEDNQGTVETNNGLIENNNGTVEMNKSDITTNNGAIVTNDGSVQNNKGTGVIESFEENNKDIAAATGDGIKINSGTVKENNGDILINQSEIVNNKEHVFSNDGDGVIIDNNGFVTNNHNFIETNNKEITNNSCDVKTNKNYIQTNGSSSDTEETGFAVVETNEGTVFNNYGIVKDNTGLISVNRENGYVNNTTGKVGENYGIVDITITADTKDEDLEKIAKNTVKNNYNEVHLKKSESDITTFFGMSGFNQQSGKDYYHPYLDSIVDGGTFTLSIPSRCGIDGLITLPSSSFDKLELIGEDLETNENGDYIVPIGTKFIVHGSVEFIGKWYRIVVSDGSVTVEEVVQNVEPITSSEAPKQFVSSVSGVEIKSWDDVSKVMETKANLIETQPNSNTKLFQLELSKDKLTIPANVVSSVATSAVDGLHCFIGNGNAITFVDNGTLENYVPTDFTFKDSQSDTMKVIDFAKPQTIGATVVLSTRVPVKNAPVAVWMWVDGEYQLLGQYSANETGNIAFPITSTGKIVLTY